MNKLDGYDLRSLTVAISALLTLFYGHYWLVIPGIFIATMRFGADAKNIFNMSTGNLQVEIDYDDPKVIAYLDANWMSDLIYSLCLFVLVTTLMINELSFASGILFPHALMYAFLGFHDMFVAKGWIDFEEIDKGDEE